ncbi:MAG: hypothetical protein JJ992_19155, partial [Planctomycetes bacterium]|nr:hypothetical protein [Planctomycetota bacterium]
SAIDAEFATTSLTAAALEGGLVNVLDVTGGVNHTVDTANAPGLTLVGAPDVRFGNIAVPFLPTHTIDEMIDGAPQIVPGQPAYYADDPTGHAYPGMVQVINHAGMDVLATRVAFPNDDVIQLDGTVGNEVTFSPGVSALQPEGVIPIYVDNTQTANDVAERISQAINQAVARGDLVGVVPHRNGNLGYDSPSTPIVDTNLVNLEGVTEVTLSSGAASPILVDGVYGLNDPQGGGGNLLVPFHRDMSRVDVADELNDALESLFHSPTIITDAGDNFSDGDTFRLEDGINAPVIFEFDSGYVLNIPLGGGMVSAGGISDGESFTITDANGTTTATFEFDKDGIVGQDALGQSNTPVSISENESALGVSSQIVNAIQGHPLQNVLGLAPRILTGNRVQLGGAVGSTLVISPGSVVTRDQGTPGVSPSLTVTLPQTLGMQLPDPLTIHIPAASITDGETFVIDDGIIPPVVFEFEDITFGDLVEPGNVMVRFTPTSSDEEIGREM